MAAGDKHIDEDGHEWIEDNLGYLVREVEPNFDILMEPGDEITFKPPRSKVDKIDRKLNEPYMLRWGGRWAIKWWGWRMLSKKSWGRWRDAFWFQAWKPVWGKGAYSYVTIGLGIIAIYAGDPKSLGPGEAKTFIGAVIAKLKLLRYHCRRKYRLWELRQHRRATAWLRHGYETGQIKQRPKSLRPRRKENDHV